MNHIKEKDDKNLINLTTKFLLNAIIIYHIILIKFKFIIKYYYKIHILLISLQINNPDISINQNNRL